MAVITVFTNMYQYVPADSITIDKNIDALKEEIDFLLSRTYYTTNQDKVRMIKTFLYETKVKLERDSSMVFNVLTEIEEYFGIDRLESLDFKDVSAFEGLYRKITYLYKDVIDNLVKQRSNPDAAADFILRESRLTIIVNYLCEQKKQKTQKDNIEKELSDEDILKDLNIDSDDEEDEESDEDEDPEELEEDEEPEESYEADKLALVTSSVTLFGRYTGNKGPRGKNGKPLRSGLLVTSNQEVIDKIKQTLKLKRFDNIESRQYLFPIGRVEDIKKLIE